MFLSDTDELTPTSHWTGFPRCPACRNRHEPEQNRAAVFGCIKQTEEKTNDCLEDNRWDSFQDIQLLMKLKGALSVFVNLCLIDNINFHQLFTTTDGEHPLCIQDFLLMRSFPSSNNTSSVEEATFRSFLAHTWRNCLSSVWLFLRKSLTAANRQLYNHNQDRDEGLPLTNIEKVSANKDSINNNNNSNVNNKKYVTLFLFNLI